MNLKAFGRTLWQRYLVHGFQRPFLMGFAVLMLMAVVDYFLRVGVLWRVTVLVATVASWGWVLRHLAQKNPRPSDDELYHYACELSGHDSLEVEPSELTLSQDVLKPWSIKAYVLAIAVLGAVSVFGTGRLALTRTFLMYGEWPKWTTIVDVEIPKIVTQDSPIPIRFKTKGRSPKMVTFYVNGQRKNLAYTGSDSWYFELYESPGEHRIQIEAGDDITDFHTVKVIPFPSLTKSSIVYQEPLYLGGREKKIQGLSAKVPEGAKVTLMTQFRDLHSITAPIGFTKNDQGFWVCEVGEVTKDRTVVVEGLSHQKVSPVELVTFRLNVSYDKRPVIKNLRPQGSLVYLPQGKLRIQFEAQDDHGLERIDLFKDVEKIFTVKEGDTVDYLVDLSKYKFKPGDTVLFKPAAVDNKGQKSETRALRVQIVDEMTFKTYLLEEHQRIHQKLEALISSIDRRVKRQSKDEMFADNIEKSTLRSDIEKVRLLNENMKRYGDRLDQLEDFEKLSKQNEKDRAYISTTARLLLEDQLKTGDHLMKRQLRMNDNLKEVSIRMAEGQNAHLINRLIDQIISKQNRVIDSIPLE